MADDPLVDGMPEWQIVIDQDDSGTAAETPADGEDTLDGLGAVDAVKVFFCYAHEDDALRRELLGHLSILRHSNIISAWYDGDITAGSDWEEEIQENLSGADVVILLVSPSFLASDYCYNIEMKKALERHGLGEARVVPVVLRPVDWEGAPFGKLQMLPKNARPITKWPDRDEALMSVAKGIRKAVIELVAQRNLAASGSGVVERIRQREEARRLGIEDVASVRTALVVAQEKVSYLESAYKELEAEFAQVSGELELLRGGAELDAEERARAQLEIQQLRAQIDNQNSSKDQKIGLLEAEAEKMRRDYLRLRDEAQMKIDRLMDRIRELNRKISGQEEGGESRKSGIFR